MEIEEEKTWEELGESLKEKRDKVREEKKKEILRNWMQNEKEEN